MGVRGQTKIDEINWRGRGMRQREGQTRLRFVVCLCVFVLFAVRLNEILYYYYFLSIHVSLVSGILYRSDIVVLMFLRVYVGLCNLLNG